MKGKIFKSFDYALANYVESPGTKGYTVSEINSILLKLSLKDINIETIIAFCDLALNSKYRIVRIVHKLLCQLLGDKAGFFMPIKAK